MLKKKETREFFGAKPKNASIVDRVRKDGYMGVMFNKSDFLDAVVWAANVVYEYRDYFRQHSGRSVIPKSDLPFLKEDLINAHYIMIIYYKMKQNLVLVEEFKISLMSVAKFQSMATDDIAVMTRWDEYLQLARQKEESGDLSGYDIGGLKGTEDRYEKYSRMVADEIEIYRNGIARL